MATSSSDRCATLTITSRTYGAWSLRGWLLAKLAGIPFDVEVIPADDPSVRAELLLLSPSFLVPRLTHGDVVVWDTLAIAEYLNEVAPEAGLLPADRAARARCRAVSGEMHQGFANLRAALPMNLRASHENFPLWAGAQADIERVLAIWDDCLGRYGGPYLFGERPTVADAMYAPVCARFRTYGVPLPERLAAYRDLVLDHPAMLEWTEAALAEDEGVDELDIEF
jgi:glutathione S-transferase